MGQFRISSLFKRIDFWILTFLKALLSLTISSLNRHIVVHNRKLESELFHLTKLTVFYFKLFINKAKFSTLIEYYDLQNHMTTIVLSFIFVCFVWLLCFINILIVVFTGGFGNFFMGITFRFFSWPPCPMLKIYISFFFSIFFMHFPHIVETHH